MSARTSLKSDGRIIVYSANDIEAQGPYGKPSVIAVVYGEPGYHPIYTTSTAERLNADDVTPEIAEAFVVGSMFGWHVPGARLAVDYARNLLTVSP